MITRNSDANREIWNRFQDGNCSVVVTSSIDDAVVTASALLPDIVVFGCEVGVTQTADNLQRISDAVGNGRQPCFLASMDSVPSDVSPASHNSEAQIRIDPAQRVGTRNDSSPQMESVQYDGIEIDTRSHRAAVDGRILDLTPTEFRILWLLINRPGQVFSREEVTRACFQPSRNIKKRTIDAHVKSIRRKLRDRSDMVETVRGIGYRLKVLGSPVYSAKDSQQPDHPD